MNTRVLSLLCTVCIGWSGLGAAADPPPSNGAKYSVDIPAEDLGDALQAFALASHCKLLYSSDLVAGKKSPALKGQFTTEEGVKRLLAGTDLKYEVTRNGLVMIRSETSSFAAKSADSRNPSGVAADAKGASAKPDPQSAPPRATNVQSESGPPSKKTMSPYVIEEVVVTGSRIPLLKGQGPQHVKTYSNEQIDQSGLSTLSDFLNTVPDVSTSNGAFGVSTAGGATTVQLHGLPTGTTLVLINGRRVEDSGFQAFSGINIFDLNTIPLAVVERIEVLPIGSSAVYGSDAIGGVVNIILKKDIDGLEANARYGGAEGPRELDANVAWGRKWEKGSVSLVATYQNQTELEGFERSLTGNQDYRPYGGPDSRVTFCSPGNVYSANGAPLPGLGTATYAAVPTGYTGTPSQTEFVATAGTQNLCSALGYQSIIPASRREGVFGYGSYQVAQAVELFSELMFSHVQLDNGSVPPLLFGVPGFQFYTVSGSNPYNPFGETVGISGLLTSVGRSVASVPTDFYRLLIGAKGPLFTSWDWEVMAVDTGDHTDYSVDNRLDGTAFRAALNSSNPATAVNPFIDGPPGSAALLQSILGPNYAVDTSSRRLTASGIARGPILEMPSGPLKVAIGVEYNRDNLGFDEINTGGAHPPNSEVGYDRQFYAAFGEARIPIISSRGDPQSGERLAVTLAGRYDHYSDFGGKTTPQFGAEWRPTGTLLVRGGYGEALRAPSLAQLFSPQSIGLAQITDPVNGGQTVLVNQTLGGNPNLHAETAESSSFGVAYASQAVPGLYLSVTWWRILQDNVVQLLSPQSLVDNESLFPGRVVRSPSGVITQINDTYVNFGRADVGGLDYEAMWARDTRYGQFTPSLSVTQTYRYSSALLPGQAPTDRDSIANDDGNFAPRWKGTVDLGWKGGAFAAHVDGRYVGKYRDYDPLPNGNYLTLGNFWLVDANVRYALGGSLLPGGSSRESVYVTAGAVNIFNKLPQFSNIFGGAYGYDPREADIRGRFVYVRVGARW